MTHKIRTFLILKIKTVIDLNIPSSTSILIKREIYFLFFYVKHLFEALEEEYSNTF